MEVVLDKKFKIDKSNWSLVKFEDVAFEPKESVKNIITEGIEHVVGLEHINSGDIHLRNSASIEESTTFTKKFAKNDVLFGRRRAYLKKAAQAEFDGICSGDITVFRAKDNLLPELLPFIVHNEKFFDYAIKHSAGGLSPRVKFKDLANYEFLLPPKDQQAKLAELLWAMDEVIEREKESRNKSIQLYLSFRKSIFTKNSLSAKSWINNLIFEKKRIEEIADTSAGGTPSTKKEEYWKNGKVPWINSGKLKNKIISKPSKYITELGLKKSSAKLWPNETTVIALTGATTGEVGYLDFECSGNQSIVAIQPQEKLISKYIYYYLIEHKHRILQQAIGSAQPHINKDIVDKFFIEYPNLESQKKLVKILDRYVDIISSFKSKISSSKALQKSLINQVF